jgi:hypothetical protein
MKNPPFVFILGVVFALSGTVAARAEKSLYSSNSLGMLSEKIQPYRRDEYAYVIEVDKSSDVEIRRLFEKEKEIRRWELRPIDGGTRREERQFEGGILAARIVYGKTGETLLEETYVGGKLSQKASLEYKGGRLSQTRVTASDGSLLYTEKYVLSSSGALRQVRRVNRDGSSSISYYLGGNGRISEELNTVGNLTLITRYDNHARIVAKDQLKDGKLDSRQEFTFLPDAEELLASTETHFADNTRTDRHFDEKGHIAGETVTKAGKVTDQIDYSWDSSGNNTMKRRKSANGIEEWHYSYDAGGVLAQEEYYRRGSHEKTIVYTAKDERYEELYQEGELFLRVFYTGDAKVKEEVYTGGTLLRERSYP